MYAYTGNKFNSAEIVSCVMNFILVSLNLMAAYICVYPCNPSLTQGKKAKKMSRSATQEKMRQKTRDRQSKSLAGYKKIRLDVR